MDDRIFIRFMKEQIIQKYIIFSSIFGIHIDRWKASNNEDTKYPYRIYFYKNNNIIGYIDCEVSNINNKAYSNFLYYFYLHHTNFNISGYYDSSTEQFTYNINDINNDTFDNIKGLLLVSNLYDNLGYCYYISSCLNTFKNNKKIFDLSFNDSKSSAILEIKDYTKGEVLGCYTDFCDNNLSINHSISKNKYCHYITDIRAFVDENDIVKLDLRFNDRSYRKEIYNNSYQLNKSFFESIDFNKISTNIKKCDSRFYKFINYIRKQLTFDNCSLYDILANYSFNIDDSHILTDIASSFKIENTGLNNKILIKMNCTRDKYLKKY